MCLRGFFVFFFEKKSDGVKWNADTSRGEVAKILTCSGSDVQQVRLGSLVIERWGRGIRTVQIALEALK